MKPARGDDETIGFAWTAHLVHRTTGAAIIHRLSKKKSKSIFGFRSLDLENLAEGNQEFNLKNVLWGVGEVRFRISTMYGGEPIKYYYY